MTQQQERRVMTPLRGWRKSRADEFMTGWKRKAGLAVLGIPALAPIAFMLPGMLTLNAGTVHGSGNDVFGSGGACLLFAMLLVTPLSLITGQRWFNPALRQWYGIVFSVSIILDAITAATDSSFAGGVAGRLAGHTFLAVGFAMVMTSVPLLVTANRRSLKKLGKYWRPAQRAGTYAIWGLLGLHLLLLEGFGVSHGNALGPDGLPYRVFHQRFYEWLAVSAFLVTFRLPSVKGWVIARQKAGQGWKVYAVAAPLFLLFLLGYVFFCTELVFKGVVAFQLRSLND